MGEVVLGECATAALRSDEHGSVESFSEHNFMWMLEVEVQWKCTAKWVAAASIGTVEPM